MTQSIFDDPTGKRWRLLKKISLVFSISLLALLLVNIIYYYQTNTLPFVTRSTLSILYKLLIIYFFSSIIIGILRLGFFMYYSWKQKQKAKHVIKTNVDYMPSVSVLIPAYNEEVGIEKTIRSILKSSYPAVEVIVIDDGSTDQTASIVKKHFQHLDKVKLLQKENGGKSSALNLGIEKAMGDIIITVDADGVLLKDSITHLVAQFQDENVAAVSGNCKIGNIKKRLPVWQHIEYVTANNLEKRALDYLNCITVVPGSNSAWRKSMVKEVGLFDSDTLAEDTDITLKMIARNYRIIYEERAVAYEECPETTRDFLKQRLRWSYGILQSLWKNREAMKKSENKLLKYIAIPNMLITYLFYLTIPLVEIVFIFALFYGSYIVILFFLFFFLSDAIAAIYAFILEKESKRPLKSVFAQRLAYRYLFTYITWKTIVLAMKGTGLSYQKLLRTGNHLK